MSEKNRACYHPTHDPPSSFLANLRLHVGLGSRLPPPERHAVSDLAAGSAKSVTSIKRIERIHRANRYNLPN